MLLQFSVENYMSFKEKAILNLEPTKDREHPENIVAKGDWNAVGFVATFGANASGKTNFFRAITVAINAIRSSNTRQVNEPLGIFPFRFSDETLDKPSKFEFRFIAADHKKYIYGFTADNRIVHEEYLYRYESSRATKVFERKNNGTYVFTAREKSSLLPLTQWNTPNKFFIATATMWNAQSTKVPFEWLFAGIDTYTNLSIFTQDAVQRYQGEESQEYIKFTERIMRTADINISKIDVNLKRVPINPNMMHFMPGVLINGQFVQPQEQTQLEIKMYHDVTDSDGVNKKRYCLQLGEESLGTQILFTFSPLLKKVLDNGKVIVIDEIDKSLHPEVVKYIVNLFCDREINKHGAQLIFTTHAISLLSLAIFRRDQIYFVDKDRNSAQSNLYSLDDYSVRKGENIERGYLLGRYGAIPIIQEDENGECQ